MTSRDPYPGPLAPPYHGVVGHHHVDRDGRRLKLPAFRDGSGRWFFYDPSFEPETPEACWLPLTTEDGGTALATKSPVGLDCGVYVLPEGHDTPKHRFVTLLEGHSSYPIPTGYTRLSDAFQARLRAGEDAIGAVLADQAGPVGDELEVLKRLCERVASHVESGFRHLPNAGEYGEEQWCTEARRLLDELEAFVPGGLKM